MIRKVTLAAAVAASTLVAASADAGTLAYWRFEGGASGADVVHNGDAGFYGADVVDTSGQRQHAQRLGDRRRRRLPLPRQRPLRGGPADRGGQHPQRLQHRRRADLLLHRPATAWRPSRPPRSTPPPCRRVTVEASYKPENGGFRTVVGRDAADVATGDGALAAFYLTITPENAVLTRYVDVGGGNHFAKTADGVISGFDFGTDPTGLTGTWYNLAAVQRRRVVQALHQRHARRHGRPGGQRRHGPDRRRRHQGRRLD